jgi:nucleoid-associated protein YgaU
MAVPVKPTKARIYNVDKGGALVVECLFNPTEYKFTKTNTWEKDKTPKRNVSMLNFQGGAAMTLTVSLLFDTYMTADQPDVRKYTEKVLDLMKIDPALKAAKGKGSRPPRVIFAWGDFWGFQSVITSITQTFTMFLATGKPVRAKLDVTFTQVESDGTYPKTNPTSYAEVSKLRVVGPGETIDSIAFQEYGDPTHWRVIADHNDLDDPLRLRPGQRLAIPPVS